MSAAEARRPFAEKSNNVPDSSLTPNTKAKLDVSIMEQLKARQARMRAAYEQEKKKDEVDGVVAAPVRVEDPEPAAAKAVATFKLPRPNHLPTPAKAEQPTAEVSEVKEEATAVPAAVHVPIAHLAEVAEPVQMKESALTKPVALEKPSEHFQMRLPVPAEFRRPVGDERKPEAGRQTPRDEPRQPAPVIEVPQKVVAPLVTPPADPPAQPKPRAEDEETAEARRERRLRLDGQDGVVGAVRLLPDRDRDQQRRREKREREAKEAARENRPQRDTLPPPKLSGDKPTRTNRELEAREDAKAAERAEREAKEKVRQERPKVPALDLNEMRLRNAKADAAAARHAAAVAQRDVPVARPVHAVPAPAARLDLLGRDDRFRAGLPGVPGIGAHIAPSRPVGGAPHGAYSNIPSFPAGHIDPLAGLARAGAMPHGARHGPAAGLVHRDLPAYNPHEAMKLAGLGASYGAGLAPGIGMGAVPAGFPRHFGAHDAHVRSFSENFPNPGRGGSSIDFLLGGAERARLGRPAPLAHPGLVPGHMPAGRLAMDDAALARAIAREEYGWH